MLLTLNSFENMMIWLKAMPMGFLRVYQNDYKVHLTNNYFRLQKKMLKIHG